MPEQVLTFMKSSYIKDPYQNVFVKNLIYHFLFSLNSEEQDFHLKLCTNSSKDVFFRRLKKCHPLDLHHTDMLTLKVAKKIDDKIYV